MSSPAGVDPTQIPAETPADYVPGLPPAQAAPATYQPQSKDAVDLLDLETKLGTCVAAAAGVGPARRRAARIDPLQALRN